MLLIAGKWSSWIWNRILPPVDDWKAPEKERNKRKVEGEEDTKVIRSGKRFRHSRLKRCCPGQSFVPPRSLRRQRETPRRYWQKRKKKERKKERKKLVILFSTPRRNRSKRRWRWSKESTITDEFTTSPFFFLLPPLGFDRKKESSFIINFPELSFRPATYYTPFMPYQHSIASLHSTNLTSIPTPSFS